VIRRLQLQDAHVQALSTALAHAPCSRLKDLDLSTNNGNGIDNNIPAAAATATAGLTEASWQAVIDMLVSNTRLEMVRLPPSPSSSGGGTTDIYSSTSKRLVRMYLRLNRQGRGRLWSVSNDTNTGTSVEDGDGDSSLPSTTTTRSAVASIDDWWPVLADFSDDLSAIWILLRGNPMLCLNAGGAGAGA
jgi:hypothetical protein